MVKILLATNRGSGMANNIEVEAGTTVDQLFADQMPGSEMSEFLINVNRAEVQSGFVFAATDELNRVTFTPRHIEGA